MGMWNSAAHPRNAKGPGGGEFAGGSSSGSSKPASSKLRAGARRTSARHPVPKGSLGFDGRTGTGYGKKGGDARVKRLQQALNKLGIKDAAGKSLEEDGRLGPLTTSAIKAWQRKNGMKPTGMVDAASLRKLGGSPRTTHHVRARAASRTASIAGSSSRGQASR